MPTPGAHPAVQKARQVVGLYGDPTITWAIGLVADLHAPIEAATVSDRLAALTAGHPDLGLAPRVECVPRADFDAVLDRQLNEPFDESGRLLRVAVDDAGTTLAVVGHHGAVDGLGLLSVLGSALGADAGTLSRGVGAAKAGTTFGRSAVRRLGEALFFPPSRLAADQAARHMGGVPPAGNVRSTGDVTAGRSVAAFKTDTSAVAAAAAHVVTEWNRARGDGARRIVVAIGASRRPAKQLHPDRDTAYLRVALPSDVTTAQAREAIARTAPEPDFPTLSPRKRIARSVARLLRNRLGSTLLVSNLGPVTNLDAVHRLAFYPAAAGLRAAAIGVVSTNDTTTITVRLSRASFTAGSADVIGQDIMAWLIADAVDPIQ